MLFAQPSRGGIGMKPLGTQGGMFSGGAQPGAQPSTAPRPAYQPPANGGYYNRPTGTGAHASFGTRGGAAAAPAPATPAPAAPAPAQQSSNPFDFLNQFLQGFASGGSSGSTSAPRPSNVSYATPYSVSSNPVSPGSWHSSGIGPGNAAANGAWQNAYNSNPTLQTTLGASNQYNGGGDAQDINNRVWGYLGTNYIQSGNPVAPGSWHSSGIGPSQAAAVGAWQNEQALNHIAQSMGWRGPQFAYRDADTSPQYYGGSLAAQNQFLAAGGQLPGAAPAAPAAGGGASTPATGGTGSVTSTIQPGGVYNGGQTQRYVNQLAGEQFTNANADYLSKQYQRPGQSRDEGTLSRIAPAVGEAAGNVRSIQAAQPLMDQVANQQQLLAGQIGQGQEATALAGILAELQRTGDYAEIGRLQALSPLFASIFGGIGNAIGGLT